jgi:polyvinyl alcohol dehydrogenase (cytochrome)
VAALILVAVPLPVVACVGDCNGDREVRVDELMTGVNVGLGEIALSQCDAIDNDFGGTATVDEMVLAVTKALEGCGGGPADQVLYSLHGNQLDVHDLATGAVDVLIPASRNTVNGQACLIANSGGNFIVGEDTGQPVERAGWGIFSPDGTLLKKLPLPERPGETEGPEPFGCVIDEQGRLLVTEVGDQNPAATNGQLLVFFPPDYDESCLLDGTIPVPGNVALGADGAIYVPAFARVWRYAPPFPSSAAECDSVSVTRTAFIEYSGITATIGAVQRPDRHWYISVVFDNATIKEHDENGAFMRDLIAPKTGGNPGGLALDSEGTLYYADIGLSGEPLPGPVAGKGSVRKITFDANGNPSLPETIMRGLSFPDAVSILPKRRPEWTTYGGSLRRTFFNPFEKQITAQSVSRLIPRWRYPTGGIVTATPSVATVDVPGEGPTSVIFAPSWDGNLYALRAENGSRLWSYEMKPQPGASYPYASSATISWVNGQQRIYIAGGMTMYCLDAVTGEEIWQFDAGTGCTTCGVLSGRWERNEILSSPAVHEERVYFGMDLDDAGNGKGGVFAVDADDGRLIWYFDLETGATCRPFSEDEIRRFDGYHSAEDLGLPDDFFATRPGCNFDRRGTTCGNVWSSVAIDARRGLLYTASSNCCTDDDPQTPEQPPPMPPHDEAIFALTLDGEPAWRWRPREIDNDDLAFGGVPNLFEVEIDGRSRQVVGIGNKDGTYYLLDRDGLNELKGQIEPYWFTKTVQGGPQGGIIASAAVGEGRVFFATAPGFSVFDPQLPAAWALNANDGSLAWTSPSQAPGFSPTQGIPGIVFMGEVASGIMVAHATADGTRLHGLDTQGRPGGAASGATTVGGMVFTGGGTGARGGFPPDSPAFEASVAVTPISAFCLQGSAGCTPPCADEIPANPCTYNFRSNGECVSEPAPNTLPCTVSREPGVCREGVCVLLESPED